MRGSAVKLSPELEMSLSFPCPSSPQLRAIWAPGNHRSLAALKTAATTHLHPGTKLLQFRRSFVGGLRPLCLPPLSRRPTALSASWFTSAQIASNAFTWGTVAVLPFYTLMVLAPNAELTKKTTESNVPYVLLGMLYAYLLYLSWTPETLRSMFASKYWLPELPGIARMFSNEVTVASAWIHLLAVDLFAARQVFQDGLKNKIETRHSVSLCLLFCPIGILSHTITKALIKTENGSH